MNGRFGLSSPYPSTSFLRQAQDRQGERIEKQAFSRLRTGRANGLERHSPDKRLFKSFPGR
ncbi:MAG: hypothetical protein LBD67_02535 [Candidatus Accumulibacter sp.]|nr:hypothetical protein [Accumulibacter sp.]